MNNPLEITADNAVPMKERLDAFAEEARRTKLSDLIDKVNYCFSAYAATAREVVKELEDRALRDAISDVLINVSTINLPRLMNAREALDTVPTWELVQACALEVETLDREVGRVQILPTVVLSGDLAFRYTDVRGNLQYAVYGLGRTLDLLVWQWLRYGEAPYV